MRTAWVVVALALVACEGKAKQNAPTLSKSSSPEILPEGTDLTFPSDPPVIATHSGGGNDGELRGGIEVWADGSVRYTLEKCRKAPRRGKLPPARVAELVAALDNAGVFAPQQTKAELQCCDCVSTSLTVRSGDKTARLVDAGCSSDPGPTYKTAMNLAHDALGTGPCGYPVPTDEEEREMNAAMMAAAAKADHARDTGQLKADVNAAIVQVFIMGGAFSGTTNSGGFSIRRDGTVNFADCRETKTVPPDVVQKLITELGKVPWMSNADADHGVRPGPDCMTTDVIINVDVANVRRRGGCGSKEPPDYASSLALATAAAGTNPCAKK